MSRLLIVHEHRVPQPLRDMVAGEAERRNYETRTVFYGDDSSALIEGFRWCESVLFAPGRKFDDAILEAGGHAKLFQLWSSGFDKFDVNTAHRLGVPVANNGGGNAIAVAEHTILLMLAIFKWIIDSHHRTVEGRWSGNSHGLDMLTAEGKTIGIIGLGEIGSRVARIATGLGMNVHYVDPNPSAKHLAIVPQARAVDLDTLIETSDVITLHVHLNAETEKMISRERLLRMKRGVVLLNVSRAQLVDQDAVLEFLNTGHLHGVGMDVYLEEPTAAGIPLLEHPHVICTPHMAAVTQDAHRLVIQNCFNNLDRVREGKESLWQVDNTH